MQIIPCNIDQFIALENKVNSYLKANVKGYKEKTSKWCNKDIVNSSTGEIAFIVDNDSITVELLKSLSVSDKNKIITITRKDKNWYPEI